MCDEFGFPMLPLGAFEPRAGGGMRLHGGSKGASAPAPDPRLVEAQISSMGIQNDAIKKIVAQSEALLPTQMDQLQFGLDSAKTAFDQSQEDRAYSLERRGALTGLQDQLVADASKFNEGARSTQLRAEATADVNAAFSNAQGQAARAASRMGVNPNSGRASAMRNSTALAQASALAGATTQANTTARSEGYALTDRATNALAGYPSLGMAATGAGASYAASGLGLTSQAAASTNAGYGTAAGIAGSMGANATNMWNAQSNAYINSQQQGESIGGLLGGAGGLLTGLKSVGWLSDPRLKESVVLVDRDERTGLNLFEFNYIGKPEQRYRGVMADEVEMLFPSAVFEVDGFLAVDYGKLGLQMTEVA